MFYSVELLTLRRNGKFAKCWLAAHLSPQVFCNRFRRQTVCAINIPKTCEELIIYFGTPGSKNKFSLYLSSQLMFGATRIHCYQVNICLKHQLEFWISANAVRKSGANDGVAKKRKKIPIDITLLPPVVPPAVAHGRQNMVTDEASITLHEDPIFIGGQEFVMREADWSDFGALTTEQMNQMLEHDGLCFDSTQPQVRALPEIDDDSRVATLQSVGRVGVQNGTEESGRVLEANGSLDQIPLPEIIEQGASTRIFPSDKGSLATPTKHKLSPISNVGTPTKRRRGLEAEYDDAPVPIQIPIPIQLPAQEIAEIPEADFLLDSLDSSVLQSRRSQKKRRIVIDAETQLSLTLMNRHRKDLFFQTRFSATQTNAIQLPLRIDAIKLLNTPSTQLVWAKPLLLDYELIILEPIAETSRQSDFQATPHNVYNREIVRGPDTPATGQSRDLSADILTKTAISAEDTSKSERIKTLDQISIDDRAIQLPLPSLTERQDSVTEISRIADTLPELPEDIQTHSKISLSISKNVRSVIRDWVEEGQPRSSSSRSSIPATVVDINLDRVRMDRESTSGSPQTPNSRSTLHSGVAYVKADLLGTLEILWTEQRIIKFTDICLPSDSSRRDACQVFVHLLELTKLKEVELTQREPYDPIYIRKYSSFY